jgi:hypothetical protein
VKNNENRDETRNNTRIATYNIQLNQSVRAGSAMPENNEIGIADQPKLHSPEGAKKQPKMGLSTR